MLFSIPSPGAESNQKSGRGILLSALGVQEAQGSQEQQISSVDFFFLDAWMSLLETFKIIIG